MAYGGDGLFAPSAHCVLTLATVNYLHNGFAPNQVVRENRLSVLDPGL